MNIAVLLLHCMLYVGFRAMHESMTSHKIKTWGAGGQAPPRWLRACDDVAETVASRHVTTAGRGGHCTQIQKRCEKCQYSTDTLQCAI